MGRKAQLTTEGCPKMSSRWRQIKFLVINPSPPPALLFPAMAKTPSRGEILSLLRSLLRVASSFSDYNIREYTKRRAIDGFRINKELTDASAIASAFADGAAQLKVARRQSLVYHLYAPKEKSIMDLETKHHKI
ncbi:hypothetical protein V2J09_019700 [Rumex salicifolius]